MRTRKTDRVYTFPDGSAYPIDEAIQGTSIFPNANDIAKAERKNPFGCVLACAFKRSQRARAALVTGTVAYVVTSVNGALKALKYRIPTETRKAIIHYDRTGKFPEEGFLFSGITPGFSIKAHKERNAVREYNRGKGGYVVQTKRRPNAGRRHRPQTFRHLSGLVKTKAAEK